MSILLRHGCRLDDLTRRFEPPDERNRWDRPLIRVSPVAVRCSTARSRPSSPTYTTNPSVASFEHHKVLASSEPDVA